jgi:hypothetical protein
MLLLGSTLRLTTILISRLRRLTQMRHPPPPPFVFSHLRPTVSLARSLLPQLPPESHLMRRGGFDSAFGVYSFSPALAPAPAPPTIQISSQDKEQDGSFPFDTAFRSTTTATTTKSETTGTDTKGGALRPSLDGGDRTSKAMALFSAFGSGSVPQIPSTGGTTSSISATFDTPSPAKELSSTARQ